MRRLPTPEEMLVPVAVVVEVEAEVEVVEVDAACKGEEPVEDHLLLPLVSPHMGKCLVMNSL